MYNNFVVKVMVNDGSVITLDMDKLELLIYQKCDGESVRVLEIGTSCENTDPGWDQLELRATVPDDLDDSNTDLSVLFSPDSNNLTIHSFKYGRGQ